jgi:hypothetical protein
MKKIFTGILLMVYMTVSSGIALEIHYCMGQKAGIEYYGSSGDRCGKCGMKDKNTGCCHDEHKFVKLEDSHKNVCNDISFAAGEKAIITDNPGFNWQLAAIEVPSFNNDHAPPDHAGPSTCILNCVFRI